MYRTLLLTWRYMTFHKIKTAILVTCITLTVYLPVAVHLLVDDFQVQLMTRAETTPLVIGAKGSRFDLVLQSLYFDAQPPESIKMNEVSKIRNSGFALPIPLHVRFRARGFPVVGTTLEYFDFRNLQVGQGRPLAILGDCILGADVAQKLGIGPGDYLMSDPENVFDIGGNYPLKMCVTGVLARSHSADDYAVFVDIKTAWIIEGIGHGHQNLTDSTDESVVLKRSDDQVVANAALPQYTEITKDNLASFHFHAEPDDLPITAVIAVPHDEKSGVLLEGRYDTDKANAQLLRPVKVVEEMMGMVFKVKRIFDANVVLVAVSTALFMVLVILLSLRLRRREAVTMFHLGCSRMTIFRLQAAELIIVLLVSCMLAGLSALATLYYAPYFVRGLLS
ncbi:MAG: hypothetical protein DRP45_02955 [Candidatus Zixiibacteriota bacterium]|nr:MAG: hypothetical protein DRP45_02955 [candidate division Zixibacteria bacterium]